MVVPGEMERSSWPDPNAVNDPSSAILESAVHLERAVLGCLIEQPSLWSQAGDLATDDFLLTDHQQTWQAFCRLHGNGTPVDIVHLTAELSGKVDAACIASLLDGCVPENFASYVRRLKEASQERKFLRAWEQLPKLNPDGRKAVLAQMQELHQGQRPSYGVISLPDFQRLCAAEPNAHVVETLIPEASVCMAVGDSGLGKSPWAYQLGMCVASGKPFLGHAVKQGPVLYIDLENGRDGILEVTRSLAKHLGLAEVPKDFLLLTDRGNLDLLAAIVDRHRPALVIVDSLRAFRPDAEEKAAIAAQLLNTLRDIAKKYKTAFLLIHHIKKPGENGVPALEDSPAMTWLLQASGARALVNQSDVRIGFDYASAGKVREEIGLMMKGFARLRGEFGPLYLARNFDEEGNPLGYRLMTGPELLFNEDQQATFATLPNRFAFKEAKAVYGRGDQATNDFLQKGIRVGIFRKPAKGTYEKVETSGVSGVTA